METNNNPGLYSQSYPAGQPSGPPKIRNPYIKTIRSSSTMLGLCIIIYIALSFFVPTAASSIVMGFNVFLNGSYSLALSETAIYSIQLISYIITYTVPFIIYAIIISMPAKIALPLKAPSASMTVSAVFIGLGASVAGSWLSQGVYFVMSMFGAQPVSPDFSSPAEPAAAILNIVMITIAAPIFEEFVFRGFIMQSFRRYGDMFALVVSAVLFALFHGNLVQAPNAFVMGIVIGFFVLKSGSLWTGIAIHFANNLISTVFTELSSGAPVVMQNLAYVILQVVFCVLGVIGFLLLMKRGKSFLHLCTNQKGQPVLSEGKKYAAFVTSPAMIGVTVVFTIIIISNITTV